MSVTSLPRRARRILQQGPRPGDAPRTTTYFIARSSLSWVESCVALALAAGAGVQARLDPVAGLGARPAPRHVAVLHHRHAVAELERVRHVLLDHEQRRAGVAQLGERVV